MRKLIIISLVFLLSEILYSQQGWFTLHTLLGTTNYTGLKFLNSQTGYLSSAFGTAHMNGGSTQKTTNGGVNWITVLYSVPEYGSFFLDVNTGWVIGGYWNDAGTSSREIFRTTNGGINFTRIYLDSVVNRFRKVFFTDDYTGFMLTTYPASLLKTTNSGFNWSESILINFYSIYFINSNTGWGTASSGNIYKTTNGGSNWSITNIGSAVITYNVVFKDINNGWVNSTSHVFKTTNGGLNWNSYSTGFNCSTLSLEFVDNTHGWIAGDSGKIAYTSNGGINWIIQQAPVVHYLKLITFVNPSTGYVTGSKFVTPYSNEEILLKTTTGGLTPVTGISNEIPKDYSLSQNYPNPFNPSTNIEFDIAKTSVVSLTIYDVTGREIENLVNEQLSSGRYTVSWNASEYSSGIYFYSLRTESFEKTRKALLIK